MIGRRDFITLLGGAATWPQVARVQQAGKLPTIGFLGADASAFSPWTAAFVAHLRERAGSRIVTSRSSIVGRGRTERYAEITAEFVQSR